MVIVIDMNTIKRYPVLSPYITDVLVTYMLVLPHHDAMWSLVFVGCFAHSESIL